MKPVVYSKLTSAQRRTVREAYIIEQRGLCHWCKSPLDKPPPQDITEKKIDWKFFPPGFLRHPVHLQHNHDTDLTEGAVHAYCNAVMWQYHNR